MSSGKTYTVDCELILHYAIQVKAQSEDEAQEKAEARLQLIADTQKYTPEDHSTEIGDIDEVER